MKRSNIFNGKKLKDARIYRGMSASELADEVHISRQAIAQFENNLVSPSLEVIFKLAGVLHFPMHYFYEPTPTDVEVYNTYFRALVSTNKKDRMMEANKTEKVALMYKFLSEYLDMPSLQIIQMNGENYSYEQIEQIAMKLREKWGLEQKPITDIVHQMEKNGIIVSSFKTDKNNIDAFSQLVRYGDENYYCVILGSDKNSATRRQFNAAHELGHIVLHEWEDDLEDISKEEFRKREDEANYFAAAFLLPKEAFLKDLLYEKNLEFYVELKKKWRVSISAMIVRAYQLKILKPNQYQYLMRRMAQLKWRNNEPLDDTIGLEEPTLFKKSIKIILDNQLLTKSEIMRELASNGLGLEREEIEDLLCLEKDTLKEKEIKDNIAEFIKIKNK